MPVINPTKHTFDLAVMEKSKDEAVVVIFTAPWCGPCKSLKPKLMALAGEWGFRLAVVDAAADPELAGLFGVRAVPTVITIENKSERGRFTGGRTDESMREYFREFGLNETPIKLEF